MGHRATTTNTSASRRRAAVLAPPLLKLGKACRSRSCCSRQVGNRRAKAPKDQRTRAATIVNDDNSRLKEKPHQQLPKPNISYSSGWLHVPSASAKRTTRARIGEGPYSSGYRCRLTIRKKTQKTPKVKKKKETLPPARGRGPPYLQGLRGHQRRSDQRRRRRRDGNPSRLGDRLFLLFFPLVPVRGINPDDGLRFLKVKI
jgi:hypothetical protein